MDRSWIFSSARACQFGCNELQIGIGRVYKRPIEVLSWETSGAEFSRWPLPDLPGPHWHRSRHSIQDSVKFWTTMAQALRPEALLQCSMPQSPVYTLTHQGHKVEGYMVALSSKVTANWPIKLNTRSLDLIDPTLWKSSQGPCLFTWMVDRLNDWCGSWEVHSTSGANSQFIARTLTYHPLLLYDVFAGGNSWPTAVASIFHRFKTSLQVGIHHPPLLRQSSITLSCLCRWKFIALRHYADLPNLDHRVHFTMPFCMYEVGCHYVRLSCLLPPSHLIMF